MDNQEKKRMCRTTSGKVVFTPAYPDGLCRVYGRLIDECKDCAFDWRER